MRIIYERILVDQMEKILGRRGNNKRKKSITVVSNENHIRRANKYVDKDIK